MSTLQPHDLTWASASTGRNDLPERLMAAGVVLKANMAGVLQRVKNAVKDGDVEKLLELVGNGIPDRHLEPFWRVVGPSLVFEAAVNDKVEMSHALLDRGLNVEMGLTYAHDRTIDSDPPSQTLPIHEWSRNGRVDLVIRAVEAAGLNQLHVLGTDWAMTPLQLALACEKQDVALMIADWDEKTLLEPVTNMQTGDKADKVTLTQHCDTYKCPEFMDKANSLMAAKAARRALDELGDELGINRWSAP